MKALSFLLPLATLPAFVAQAADNAGALEGFFPTDGSLKNGAHVQVVFSEGFRAQLQKLSDIIKALPEAKRAEYAQKISSWTTQPPYDPEVWTNKDDYNEFVAEWRKAQVRPTRLVALGLNSVGEGIWRIFSATVDAKSKQSIPLTISSLRYDANRNVWISNNGELTATPCSIPETSIYGAQTGTEWNLEKSDNLTVLRESVRITKTTDGKFIYLAYGFVEQSVATGVNIAHGEYLLQFPVQTAGANLGTPGQR